MKTLCFLSAFLILSCSAAAQTPEDILGWEDARWGMTTEQLREAFGDRFQPVRDSFSAWDGRVGSGKVTHEVQFIRMGKVDVYAQFQMDPRSGKLKGVLIRPYNETEENFFLLQAFIRNVYGRSAEVERHVPGGQMDYSTWSFPSTAIVVGVGRTASGDQIGVHVWYFPVTPKRRRD